MNAALLDDLSKETLRLIRVQSEAFQEALKLENFLNKEESQQDKTIGVKKVQEWQDNLENERQKLEKNEMVLAVIGTMKAGKSTTINAIVGMDILPNRETPMTTLPTLIRNVHGQQEPVLKIEKRHPLERLSQAIAKKLRTLSESEINQIDLQGIEDGKTLIATLKEQGFYTFISEYQGQAGIFDFLKHLNDLMRLAKDAMIAIEPPYSEYEKLNDLPVIEVEFCHLKGLEDNATGSLAILDTPGPDEFGQSEALRRVFTTQLKKASAILLVVDFTKMNNESDADVRKQLDEIKDQLSKDRLSVIVNKFDNAQTMTVQQTKEYVAGKLMAGEVEVSNIFPVSSRHAYLANRARSHLEHHETLPDYEQEPWVADFAKKKLGRKWQTEINDIEEVKACIEELWQESLFEQPINSVVKEAHTSAAMKSLKSAIDKLSSYHGEFNNALLISSSAMTQDIATIQLMIDGLEKDIERCKVVRLAIDDEVKKSLSTLSTNIAEATKLNYKSVTHSIDEFFKKGRALEQSEMNAFVKAEMDKLQAKMESGVPLPTLLPSYLYKKKQEEKIRSQAQRRFGANESSIRVDNEYERTKLIEDINADIACIFNNADKELNTMSQELITNTTQEITKSIDTAVGETLKVASKKMNDSFQGNNKVDFNLPSISLEMEQVDTNELFSVGAKSGTGYKTETRHKKGLWGGLCKMFGSKEWGTEEYEVSYTTYSVDLAAIKSQVMEQLNTQARALSNQTGSYLKAQLQPAITQHLDELENYLERYRGVLSDGMQNSRLEQNAKQALITQLNALATVQTTTQGQIAVVKAGLVT